MEIFASLLPATRDGEQSRRSFGLCHPRLISPKIRSYLALLFPSFASSPAGGGVLGPLQTTAKRVHNRPRCHWPASGSWASPASPDFPCRQKGDNGSLLVSVPRLDHARALVGPPIDLMYSHSLTNRRWTWNGKHISSNLIYLAYRESPRLRVPLHLSSAPFAELELGSL